VRRTVEVSSERLVSRQSFIDRVLIGSGVLSFGGIAGSVGSVLAEDKTRSGQSATLTGQDPMHLHGTTMRVFAKDGWPINSSQMCDTIDVAPGNRYDAIVEATVAGTRVFHWHILSRRRSTRHLRSCNSMLVE